MSKKLKGVLQEYQLTIVRDKANTFIITLGEQTWTLELAIGSKAELDIPLVLEFIRLIDE